MKKRKGLEFVAVAGGGGRARQPVTAAVVRLGGKGVTVVAGEGEEWGVRCR